MHLVTKLKKTNGKLVNYSVTMLNKLEHFTAALQEGQIIEAYFELVSDDKTLGQLAKVHAMIRELANFTGATFEEMKLEIKKKSGLFTIVTIGDERLMHCRSFEHCSKEELSLAIQACLEIGEFLNYNLG